MTIELQRHIDASGADKRAVFGKIFSAVNRMMPKRAMDSSQTNAYDLAIAELEHAKSMDEKAESEQHKAILRASGAIDDAEKHLKEAEAYRALGQMFKVAIDPRTEPKSLPPLKKRPSPAPPSNKQSIAKGKPAPSGSAPPVKDQVPAISRNWWKGFGGKTPSKPTVISAKKQRIYEEDRKTPTPVAQSVLDARREKAHAEEKKKTDALVNEAKRSLVRSRQLLADSKKIPTKV